MAAAAKRTNGGQVLQSRPGISDRPDLISNQPDAVLGSIVSLLSTRDGCRTQVLSRRWRPIWRSAPLNLVATRGRGGLRTISDILDGHLGPFHRISITGIAPIRYRYERHTGRPIVDDEARAERTRFERRLSSWDVLASVQVLDLGYSYGCDVLPPSLFRLAPALQEVSLGNCSLPPNLSVDFPSLEKLSLRKVTLAEETLTALLAGCPALRSLLMVHIVGSDRLRISSPTLRSIGYYAPSDIQADYYCRSVKVQELVIEDVPSLERLLQLNPSDGPPTIRVIRAPKLEILGCMNEGTSQLHLGTTVFQKTIAASLTTTMRSVKVLALDAVGPNLDVVLGFLKCFPGLERLYMFLGSPHPYCENGLYPSRDDPIECLKFHLKKVVLKAYYGGSQEVDFARFFVLNAQVLEKMEFGLVNDPKEEWRGNHNMQLQLKDRASHNARFEFKKFAGTTFSNIDKCTHDLSTVDPFDECFLDRYVTFWQV